MKIKSKLGPPLASNAVGYGCGILILVALLVSHLSAFAGAGDTSWMIQGKYGIFMHYQYRILLGYSIATKPQFPQPAEMSAAQWNQFVDGFDVAGFAQQMAEAKVGWVIFCMDDCYFGWQCAPNRAFDRFTGYAPGQRCSKRDLIADLAKALRQVGVRLILDYSGLSAYIFDKQSLAGTSNVGDWKLPPSAESRKRHMTMLKEYADRYRDTIDGWWFDAFDAEESYAQPPDDYATIGAIVRAANPKAIIAFSGNNTFSSHRQGVDDYTSGDTWSKLDLKKLTPKTRPAGEGLVWHGKMYCGNVYHGLGNANQYRDQELIDWIKTCNSQGGVCTLDWPFDPKTGLIKDFGLKQMINISKAVK